MKHQKILSLLNEANDYIFVIRQWNIFNDTSNPNYNLWNEIINYREVLKPNLCGYNKTWSL